MNANNTHKYTKIDILPKDWKRFRLGDIAFFFSGGTPLTTNKNYYNGTIPFIKSAEIYFETTQEFLTDEGLQNSSAKWVSKGDLLFALYGANSGEVAVSKIDGVINQAVLCIKNDKQISDTTFLYNYFLMAKRFLVAKFLQGGQGNLSAQIIKQIQIPLPPLAEQEKIAQILGVWDKGISVLKSLIEAKTKRKKALMQRLLTPPTHPLTPSAREGEQKSHHDTKAPPLAGGVGVGYSHIENNRNDDKVLDCHDLTASNLAMTEKNSKAKQSLRFAEFTDKWQEMRLGDICKIKKGEQLNKLSLSNNSEGKFAVINGGILPSGYTDKFNTNENTITISEGGNSCGFVNFIKEKFWSGGHCYAIMNSKASVLYLYYFLKFKETFIQELRVGSGLPNIQKKDIENFKVSFPALAEQKKIAQVLSACDKEIELLKSKFQCLKMQKKGLMQRLLNGKVRVNI